MDEAAKKTTLRMIPYGLFVATTKDGEIEFTDSPNGLPVLKDALGYFECKVTDTITRGDHTIFVGEVIESGLQKDGEPLTLAETGFKYGG